MKEKLYIIDGTNLIFRAYYAIRHLTTSTGFPTNAIYGFINMLLKLIREEKPEHLVIVFDSGKPSFREEIYPEYKANREEAPDDLKQQIPHIPRCVKALNIPVMSVEGVEADDVIGTVAIKAEKEGLDVVIVTGDKDFMQLVRDDISLLDTMKLARTKEDGVLAKFGVKPSQVIDVLGLMGDASDNIPGVKGVGPKTATKLIQEYGSLEAVLENAHKLDGALKDRLIAHQKDAILSKELATIKTDVDVAYNLDDFAVKEPEQKILHDLLKEFEFSSLITELTPKKGLSRDNYKLITSEEDLEKLVEGLKSSKLFAFDTETTSLDAFSAHLVGLSFAFVEGEAYYIPVGHTGLDAVGQLPRENVLNILRPIFADASIKKTGQNCNYDISVLEKYGIVVNGIVFDTMIASYVLNPGGSHGMDDLSQQLLDHTTIKYEDVVGKGKKQINFSDSEIEKAYVYSAEDADVTLRLYNILREKIDKSPSKDLFYNIEMPVMETLFRMERNGVKIDSEKLAHLSREFDLKLRTLEKEIYQEAGEAFNINSPKQLGTILFEKLGLPGAKKTKTGFSTDIEVLTNLSAHHKLPAIILDYRSLSKLKNTYIDALPKLVNKRTGRIHTDFNQTIAETGRLSSSDPNLQNIPARSEDGRRIREAFIAEDGFLLLSSDYSQIELRILAHITKEPALIEAFNHGVDVHSVTASGIFGKEPKDISKEERAVGKTVNFATIYGQSAYGLSKQLKIEPSVAQEYIDNYFRKYPFVAKYREEAFKTARKTGYVETLFGRRRYLPDINSKNQNIRHLAERMAFNTIFQGSAADIIKIAMINIDKGLAQVLKTAKMLLQVHDELVFEVREEDLQKVKTFVVKEMESATKLLIPLTVDVGTGKNWAECG